MRFSVITCIANLDKYRQDNYIKVVEQWLHQDYNDYEFICIEMFDKEDHFTHGKYNYYSMIGEEFKRGWLLNIGAKKSIGDVLVFVDADVIVRKDYLSELDKWFSIDTKSAIGLNQLIRLNRDGSIKTSHLSSILAAAGGINVFDAQFFFEKLGGWNETFSNGGGNDNDIMFRAKAAGSNVKIFPIPIIHLWHPAKKYGNANQNLWSITQAYPELVTQKILELGIGGDKPAVYDYVEMEELLQ